MAKLFEGKLSYINELKELRTNSGKLMGNIQWSQGVYAYVPNILNPISPSTLKMLTRACQYFEEKGMKS